MKYASWSKKGIVALAFLASFLTMGTVLAREDFYRPAAGNIRPDIAGIERATVNDQGVLMLTTAEGAGVSGFPAMIEGGAFVTAPVMIDFAGNGTLYLAAVTRDVNDNYTLHAFDSAGAKVASILIGKSVYYDPVVWSVPGTNRQDVVLVAEDGTVFAFSFSNNIFTKNTLVSLGAPAAITFAPSADEFTAVFPQSKAADVYVYNQNNWQLSRHLVLANAIIYPVVYNNQSNIIYGVTDANKLTAVNAQTGNTINGFPVALSGFALSGPTLTNANPVVAGLEITVPAQNKVLVFGADGSPLGSVPTNQPFVATAGSLAVNQSVYATLNAFSAALTIPLGAAQVVSPLGSVRLIPLANPNDPQISLAAGLLYHHGSALANGQTFNYGDVDASTTSYAFLKVINAGAGDLHFSATPTLSGINAAEFAVKSLASLTIPANSSTTFYVRLLPLSSGAKQATLTIDSDDPNENPFIVHLAANVKDVNSIVYEDAEDGLVSRWAAADDTNGQKPMTITNVADDQAHGKVIDIAVTDYNKQDFVLLNADGVSRWNNDIAAMRRLKFDLKTVNDVNIYVRLRTQDGSTYFLAYNFDNPNNGLVNNRYAYIKLDPAFKDGQWHTITRDLTADFAALVPGQSIAYVNSFELGSLSARVDNVLLTKDPLVAYQVNGAVTDANNVPIPGVLLTLTPYGQTTVTNASGTYAFAGIENGTYTVKAASAQYDFATSSIQVVVNNANATANFVGNHGAVSIYEDAEDGTTARWKLTGGTGVNTITNVIDDNAHNKVIEIANSDYLNNNYLLNDKDGITPWRNSQDTIIKFDLKTTNDVYAFVAVQTNQQKTYYLWYSFSHETGAQLGRYAAYNFNPAYKDGQWHTITRDLAADLQAVFPGVNITAVDNIMVGSQSARVDNIKLVNAAYVHAIKGKVLDQNGQPLVGETVKLTEDNITTVTDNTGAYQFGMLLPGSYTVAPVDGLRVFNPVSKVVTISNADETADFAELMAGTIVYEDAEDGSVGRWVATGQGGVNSIANVVDADAAHNKVIEIKNSDYYNYNYTLKAQDGVSLWNNTLARTFAFDVKTEDDMRTFIRVTTDQGTRFFMYSFAQTEGPFAGRYYGFSLSPSLKDGAWHTVVRDLTADLAVAFPGETITAVEEFIAGGINMRVDNVKLSGQSLVFTVAGTVLDGNNQPLTGTQLTINPGGQTVTVDQNGAYSFGSLVAGQYTITPAKPLYVFTPPSASVTITNGNQTANFVGGPQTAFIYEDGEDGLVNKWKLLGNSGVNSITNVADDNAHNKVIEIASSDAINNNYILGDKNGDKPWNNSSGDIIKFDLKTANDVSIFVEVVANGQTRYVMYSTHRGTGLVFGRYASLRLDPAYKDGAWHTITRDLTADLQTIFPGEQITVVNSFTLGAVSARVDNVTLLKRSAVYAINGTVKDGNNQPVAGIAIALAPDNVTTITDANGAYSFGTVTPGTYTVTPASPVYSFAPANQVVVVANANMTADFTAAPQQPANVVYENAEDGSVQRWKISGAGGVDSIENIVDEDAVHNKVIEIKDQDHYNYNYTLYAADGLSPWNNTLSRTLSVDYKTQSATRLFVQMTTDQGTRFLMYSFAGSEGPFAGRYYGFVLDGANQDNAWHTLERNLTNDVATAFPGATIISVDGIIVGSPGIRIDNVTLKP